ncbi:MAG: hypothetical protein EA361_05180 [Bacteroidetes bacterium]|nr:MAG: hypothetical protein EA361_05180 [Bacteroidota bacterium]
MEKGILNLLLATVFAVFLLGCTSPTGVTGTTANADATGRKKPSDWQGVYTGNFPGEQEGSWEQAVILLNRNYTYSMETKTSGESDEVKQRRGTLKWDRRRNTVQMYPFPERLGSPVFELGENHIVQLNTGGNANEVSEGSTTIILRREPNPVLERTWQLTNLPGYWVGINDRITIAFKIIDQRVVVNGVCSRFPEQYVFHDDGVQIKYRITGGYFRDRSELKTAFLMALTYTDDIKVSGDYLMLISNKQTIATFELVE